LITIAITVQHRQQFFFKFFLFVSCNAVAFHCPTLIFPLALIIIAIKARHWSPAPSLITNAIVHYQRHHSSPTSPFITSVIIHYQRHHSLPVPSFITSAIIDHQDHH